MFTNTRAEKNTITSGARKYLILLALSMFAIGIIYLVCISLNITESQTFADITQAENYIRIFDAITEGFLKRFIIPFELVSILLFAVVVGVSDNAK